MVADRYSDSELTRIAVQVFVEHMIRLSESDRAIVAWLMFNQQPLRALEMLLKGR